MDESSVRKILFEVGNLGLSGPGTIIGRTRKKPVIEGLFGNGMRGDGFYEAVWVHHDDGRDSCEWDTCLEGSRLLIGETVMVGKGPAGGIIERTGVVRSLVRK